MDSTQKDFDWHRNGVWIMHTPDGTPVLASVADTPYSCRAEFLRIANLPWSRLHLEGYTVRGYEVIKKVDIRLGRDVVTSNEARWRYPVTGRPEDQPPSGDMWLLTKGKIGVPGSWRNDGGFIAWMPKARRDKELEQQYGL